MVDGYQVAEKNLALKPRQKKQWSEYVENSIYWALA